MAEMLFLSGVFTRLILLADYAYVIILRAYRRVYHRRATLSTRVGSLVNLIKSKS